ncbi:cytochrome P450 [Micromonospora sp. NPDC051227]|uniref:cytochrome P450 n=1 Tax=Micromonospora sp. NPDC051227 TaxID=3364285 RepID=UPI00379E5F91
MTNSGPDLTDVELFVRNEHHRTFAEMRRSSPIYWNEGADGNNFWALTTYDDVVWAYRNHELFSSARGAIVGGSFRSRDDTAAGSMLVAADLPRHRLLKQQILPAFSAAALHRVSVQVSLLIDRAVDKLLAEGGGDFATEVAAELPAGALMAVFGIGYDDAHALISLTRRMMGYRDEQFVDTGTDGSLRLAWLQAEIFDFFANVAAARRRNPGDDLVSLLLGGKVNNRPLSEEEVFYNCLNVAVGGNETSSYTVCSGLVALIENPDQFDRLAANADLLDSALNEILRWSSTNSYVQRVATRDVIRNGVVIGSGDSVTLWNVSANRDENQFPDAELFDVGRNPNRHVTYGVGIHRCMGAPVAQIEMSHLFRRLLAAGVRLELAGPLRRLRSNFILGITRLPIKIV